MPKLKKLFDKHVDTTVRQQTLYITQRYLDAGYECWIVGGPTRDMLLGNSPKDIDFATNCPLETTKMLFDNVIPTGEDHGTLTIHIDGENYEVTRYRKDVDTDGRRATIEYAETIEEDVMRRDLTVNAIAFNPVTGEVVDAVGGLKDMKDRVLRFVGNTRDRVLEDQLRSLRLYRFIVRFKNCGFTIDEKILPVIHNIYDHNVVSVERIYQELDGIFKVLKTDNSMVEFLISEFEILDVFKRFDVNKKIYREIFELCDYFPLVKHLNDISTLKLNTQYKKLVSQFGSIQDKDFNIERDVKDLLELVGGDKNIATQLIKYCNYYNPSKKTHKALHHVDTILSMRYPFMIKHLTINGSDLQSNGYEGIAIGEKLRQLLVIVKNDPHLNTRERLLET